MDFAKNEASESREVELRRPAFAEAFWFWLKLGCISFGGPAGQIAVMHQELVERRRWISEASFLHALNYCMLLPGPEAQQLATYAGWLLHGTLGGFVAGAFFVLPSMFLLWGLSLAYVGFGSVPWVAAVFYGLKPAVVGIIAAAVLRVGRKALKEKWMWFMAAAAFVALFVFKVPFPAVLLVAALAGWIASASKTDGGPDDAREAIPAGAEVSRPARPSFARSARVAAAGLLSWWLPVLALGLWLGPGHVLVRQALFFSKAAMLTFGGAYAVLPYVSQQAVELYSWLSPSQMLDGLAFAETTPGPLIMVLEFVGFLGAWNQPAPFTPFLAATLGALVSVWCTFAPCFLWIFLGAPYSEWLRGNRRLNGILSAITAAVVGVILNLAVWAAIPVFFPADKRVDGFSIGVAVLSLAAVSRWRWHVLPVVFTSAALGVLWKVVF
jgi:chromate transporter